MEPEGRTDVAEQLETHPEREIHLGAVAAANFPGIPPRGGGGGGSGGGSTGGGGGPAGGGADSTTGPTFGAVFNTALANDLKSATKATTRLGISGLLRKGGFSIKEFDALVPGDATVVLTGVGSGKAGASRKVTIAKGRRRFSRAGKGTIKVKLTRKGKRLLRRARKVKAKLTLKFTRASGGSAKKSKKLTLKRRNASTPR